MLLGSAADGLKRDSDLLRCYAGVPFLCVVSRVKLLGRKSGGWNERIAVLGGSAVYSGPISLWLISSSNAQHFVNLRFFRLITAVQSSKSVLGLNLFLTFDSQEARLPSPCFGGCLIFWKAAGQPGRHRQHCPRRRI